MQLIWVDPKFLDVVWAKVTPLLEKAIACNLGEATCEQVRMQVAYGAAELLVARDNDLIKGVAVIEFKQHPNFRVAHISYVAGMTSKDLFDQMIQWAKSRGASFVEGYGSDAIVRLWKRYGFSKAYNLVRVPV